MTTLQGTFAPKGYTSTNRKIEQKIEKKIEQKIEQKIEKKIEQKIQVSIVSRIENGNNYADTFNVSVSVNETIAKLKTKIYSHKQSDEYEEKKQDLFYKGKLLQDDLTMSHYGIGNGAKIFLRKEINVTIITNGEDQSLPIEETIRLIDLMSLFVTDNYNWELNGRIFNGNDLYSPLWAIGINDGSQITVG